MPVQSPIARTSANELGNIAQDGPTRYGPRKRRKIVRSKEGCLVCRRRKKRCDMVRPTCESCTRLNKECEWPSTSSPGTTPASSSTPHPPLPLGFNDLQWPSSPHQLDAEVQGAVDNDWLDSMIGVNEGGEQRDIDDLWDPAMWSALFDPSGSILQPDNSAIIPSPLPTLSPTVSLDRPTISRSSDDDQLWQHVETHLSAVLGCEATPHIYISLSQLVNNPLAQCLREILLATSAQMLTKQDHPRFEMIGRQKEVAAMTVLEARMGEWEMGAALMWDQEEQWTTLATILMMSHLKRLQGQVWGFERLMRAMRSMSSWVVNAQDTRELYIFEHIALHDLFSTLTYRQGFALSYDQASFASRRGLFPLTGITFPLFSLVRRVLSLVHRRRAIAGTTWDDDQHVDMVEAAEALLEELKEEKKRMDRLTREHSHLATHRFLHEAFRTACLLQIRGYILVHPPCAVDIGLLVRQNLSLLETMLEQRLPGLTLVHWVMFVTAVNCIPSKKDNNEQKRISKLYEAMKLEQLGCQLDRSRRVVQEVWNRNQGGQLLVDWMAILDDWDWEVFFI